jgi:pimeloyl-ACP methyl ester carboxylesterase
VARPLDEVTLKDKTVHIGFKAFRLAIDGTLNEAGTEISGKFKQGGLTLPIVFKKSDHAPAPRKRPQEPKPPYPYLSVEVTYENKPGHAKLAGTLTIPRGDGRFPAVLLITGSGPQDRDEQIFGHRPFLVLADYLSRRGIAVLRVDDRGVGKSTGDVQKATSEDFAGDVEAGVAFLRSRPEVDPAKIGLIGHSEGGLIAPMVANRTHDVAFIVMLAGPGVTGTEILRSQLEFLLKQVGASDSMVARTVVYQNKLYAAVNAEHDAAALDKKMKALKAEYLATLTPAERKLADSGEDSSDQSAKALGSPWFRFFLAYDPRPALTRVQCPVLALIGEKDMQVPAKANIPELEKALKSGGNKDFTVRELPHLNHLFQTCENGSVTEYAKIEETFSPSALVLIGKWIAEHTSTNSSGAAAAQ